MDPPRHNGGINEPVPVDGSFTPPPRPPTLSDQWRTALRARDARERSISLVELPSGLSVRATRPSLLWLYGAGRVPDALAGPVQELIALGSIAGGEDQIAAEIRRQQSVDPVGFAASFLAIIDLVWCAAVVDPPFAAEDDTSNPEALPVSSVEIDDKTFLYVWAQGVDQSIATFLDRKRGTTTALGDASDRERIRTRPSRTSGNQPED